MINLAELVNTDPFLLFFGSFYLVIGLSVFFAADAWKEFIALFVKNDAISLIMGILTLPIALFIVVFYNYWGDLASSILMVMGYITLFKSVALLLRPSFFQGFLNKGVTERYLWLDGLSGIILGGAMLVL